MVTGDSIIEKRLREVEMGLNTHEAVCAERYNNIIETHNQIKKGMARSDALLIKIGLAIMGGMALILLSQLFHFNFV